MESLYLRAVFESLDGDEAVGVGHGLDGLLVVGEQECDVALDVAVLVNYLYLHIALGDYLDGVFAVGVAIVGLQGLLLVVLCVPSLHKGVFLDFFEGNDAFRVALG